MSKRTRLVTLLALAGSSVGAPAFAQQTPDPTPTPTPTPAPTPGESTPPAMPEEAKPPATTPTPVTDPVTPPKADEKKKDPPPPAHAKWDMTLYGFVEFDAIEDSTQGLNDLAGNTTVARPNTYAGDHPQTTYGARNSRFGVKLSAPEFNGVKASAQLEMDFLGNQPPGISEAAFWQNPTFRYRHLNVKLETKYLDVLAGQYWNLFGWQSSAHPNTVAIQGIPGQVYGRAPQIRLGKVIKGGVVDVDLEIAAVRPVDRISGVPDGQAGIKLMLPDYKGWHTAGSTGSSLDAASLGVSVIGRRFAPPAFSATPKKQTTANGYGVSIDAMIPIIPATKEKHDGALTLQGSFVYGAGIADQYTSLNGGVANAALPNPGGTTPAPAYTSVIDGGLALYQADGSLHPIQWTSYLVGAQYYVNSMLWVSANYSHLESGNAHLFGPANKVWDNSNFADGNLFVDLTPAVRLGVELEWIKQTFVDKVDSTDYREQLSAFFIF
ncbi:hypothetical protein BH11MYX1_BH11MYX1_09280 [soil metagenome]